MSSHSSSDPIQRPEIETCGTKHDVHRAQNVRVYALDGIVND